MQAGADWDLVCRFLEITIIDPIKANPSKDGGAKPWI